jgi:hypothetical protein
MTIKRGQVFVVKPDQDGKERPLVIVSHDVLNIAKGPIGTFDEAQLGRLMTAVKWSLAIP